jgi:hypothetical protein
VISPEVVVWHGNKLNATMMVGADLGIMDMDTAITNISIIGIDALGIYIALGNVGVRICATEDRQAFVLSGATDRTTVVPLTRCEWCIKTYD